MTSKTDFAAECRAVGLKTYPAAARFFGVGRATIGRWRASAPPAIVLKLLRYMRVKGVSAAAFDATTGKERK